MARTRCAPLRRTAASLLALAAASALVACGDERSAAPQNVPGAEGPERAPVQPTTSASTPAGVPMVSGDPSLPPAASVLGAPAAGAASATVASAASAPAAAASGSASSPSPAASLPQPVAPAASAPAQPAAGASGAAFHEAPAPGSLRIPVDGITAEALQDTWNEARPGERRHEALDVMAPRGTPVRAVADGTIVKLFDSKPGGLTIYQFDPSGTYAYYYAHLDRYAQGLSEGQAIRRGDLVGYVGSTGNASSEAPHLHFAVFRLGPERQWWKGTPINPYPLLTRNAG